VRAIEELQRLGYHFTLEGDRLHYRGPENPNPEKAIRAGLSSVRS
jgi:hypothetical protein